MEYQRIKEMSCYKIGTKVKVKDRSMKRMEKGRIVDIYDHFYLVQHRYHAECYNKVDLICNMVTFEILKG